MSLEVADLVDKLGRAVLQRDENLREKSKAQAVPWSGAGLSVDLGSGEDGSALEGELKDLELDFRRTAKHMKLKWIIHGLYPWFISMVYLYFIHVMAFPHLDSHSPPTRCG